MTKESRCAVIFLNGARRDDGTDRLDPIIRMKEREKSKTQQTSILFCSQQIGWRFAIENPAHEHQPLSLFIQVC